MSVMWLQRLVAVVVKSPGPGVRLSGLISKLYTSLVMNSLASHLNSSVLLFFPP